MTTTRQYDNFNRLTSVSADPSGAGEPNISYGYAYNSAHQRTQATLEDGSYWVYQYDALGQVVSGKRFWSDGTPVAGQQFEYGFDDIGNRELTRKGGNEFGVGLRTEGYTANNLNQYTGRTVPGAVDVIGEANSGATVTVNTRSTSRKGSYFRAELFTDNAGSLQYLSLTNHAVLNDGPDITNSVLGELLIPASPEVFFHDADGNLLRDGLWTNTWDHENRLIATESVPDVPVVAKRKLEFVYDPMGRRISKTVSTNSGSGWVEQYQRKFIYDGWNVVAELDGSDSLVQTYIWGLDLSGSQQGAGGVGGLLMVGGEHLAAYDGNGNVVGLVSSIDGTRSAEYEYDPFGGTLRATGVASESNPFRFSTKYTDDETGLLYYGYRYYNPGTGRWPNRDPIQERGGLNLYGFTLNNPNTWVDALGLSTICYNVGFDTSAQATKDNIAKLKRSFDRLNQLLSKCCSKFGVGCGINVKANYDYNQKKGPKGGYSDATNPDFSGISGAGCIPILVTTLPITQEWQGNTMKANANTTVGGGILYNINSADDGTIAHETGHWGGYDQGDIEGGDHHSDPNNPMSYGGGKRGDPDKCYCEKVSKLAR